VGGWVDRFSAKNSSKSPQRRHIFQERRPTNGEGKRGRAFFTRGKRGGLESEQKCDPWYMQQFRGNGKGGMKTQGKTEKGRAERR